LFEAGLFILTRQNKIFKHAASGKGATHSQSLPSHPPSQFDPPTHTTPPTHPLQSTFLQSMLPAQPIVWVSCTVYKCTVLQNAILYNCTVLQNAILYNCTIVQLYNCTYPLSGGVQ
jgi:hypothetical protein